jgi:carbonic anhydrase
MATLTASILAVVTSYAALVAGAMERQVPDATMRVSFSKHGSDWSQGKCSSRAMQSPVNLNELYKPIVGSFLYFYANVHSQNITVVNDGRTLSVNTLGQGFGGVSLPGAKYPWYNLKRIDFKASSEHTLRGQHAPLEIQLVHQSSTIEDPTAGSELVTVSILVECDHAPKAEPMWPGFLQRHQRGRAHRWPAAEVDGATLAQSSDGFSLGLGGTVSADGTYTPPSEKDANFNPTLQKFVQKQPPVFTDEVNIEMSPEDPLRLGPLLAGGTFFTYSGSETLPPCEERVIWLVRRERVKASDAQVRALFDRLYKTSKGLGNYRTIMPLNQRVVQVWSAAEQEPPAIPLKPPGSATIPQDAHDDGLESRSNQLASDAMTIAQAAQNYAKGIELRHELGSKAFSTTRPQPPPLNAGAPQPKVKPRLDEDWASEEMAKEVKNAIRDAVAENVRHMLPAAVSLSKSFLRQELLRAAGFPNGVGWQDMKTGGGKVSPDKPGAVSPSVSPGVSPGASPSPPPRGDQQDPTLAPAQVVPSQAPAPAPLPS